LQEITLLGALESALVGERSALMARLRDAWQRQRLPDLRRGDEVARAQPPGSPVRARPCPIREALSRV